MYIVSKGFMLCKEISITVTSSGGIISMKFSPFGSYLHEVSVKTIVKIKYCSHFYTIYCCEKNKIKPPYKRSPFQCATFDVECPEYFNSPKISAWYPQPIANDNRSVIRYLTPIVGSTNIPIPCRVILSSADSL